MEAENQKLKQELNTVKMESDIINILYSLDRLIQIKLFSKILIKLLCIKILKELPNDTRIGIYEILKKPRFYPQKIYNDKKISKEIGIEMDQYNIKVYDDKYGNPKYIFFHGAKNPNYIFSNWAPIKVTIGPLIFATAEHALMYKKAILFGDIEVAKLIKMNTNPAEAKKLGRQVKNFDDKTWMDNVEQFQREIITAKSKNPFIQEILKKLKETYGDKLVFAEASKNDKRFGIGIPVYHHKKILDEELWGSNILGKCWQQVYEEL